MTPRRLVLALFLIGLPGQAAAAPGILRVSLPAGLVCPSPPQLLAALSERFGPDRIAEGNPQPNELGLSLALLPSSLELSLSSQPGQSSYRRELPSAQGTCADLAQTIGLLVDAWLRDLPWHGAGFLRDVPEGPVVPAQLVVVSPPSAPVAARSSPGAGPLTLRLGGGGRLWTDGSFGPQGTFAADLSLPRRFGVAALASVLDDSSAQSDLQGGAAGRIRASRQTFALAGRYALAPDDESGLRFYAGIALLLFEAQASGFTTNAANTDAVPAAFAAALWQQRLWGRLSIFAQVATFVGPPTHFQIASTDGVQTVLTLAAASFDFSVGLALRLF